MSNAAHTSHEAQVSDHAPEHFRSYLAIMELDYTAEWSARALTERLRCLVLGVVTEHRTTIVAMMVPDVAAQRLVDEAMERLGVIVARQPHGKVTAKYMKCLEAEAARRERHEDDKPACCHDDPRRADAAASSVREQDACVLGSGRGWRVVIASTREECTHEDGQPTSYPVVAWIPDSSGVLHPGVLDSLDGLSGIMRADRFGVVLGVYPPGSASTPLHRL